MNQIFDLSYLIAAISFIYGIKMLSHPRTARTGNLFASLGMLIAIISTLYVGNHLNIKMILLAMLIGAVIGSIFARTIQMTAMPQLVAVFNGFGGGASTLIAGSEFLKIYYNQGFEVGLMTSIILSVIIGTITFSGSFIAFAKLQDLIKSKPVIFFGQKIFNGLLFVSIILFSFSLIFLNNIYFLELFFAILISSFLLGLLLVIPIGGADMPVVISLLNSYSGLAAAMTGFIFISNGTYIVAGNALIICGSLVGASGLILTQIMCKGMNRSLLNVIFGAVGSDSQDIESNGKQINIKSYSTDEAAIIFDSAEKVIIVPGYGLAVAQAQHLVKELTDYLESMEKKVLFAIHPVAGRMPGHMNVLLAEANIDYEQLKDLKQINPEFEQCDVALVLGANDVVNPAARHDKSSPIYGMPILNVDKSQTVIINKRSMNPGFAGVQNELFGYDNSIMVFGDAKDMLTDLITALKEL